jgi:methionine sulfoxide reductase heme-binding subunit
VAIRAEVGWLGPRRGVVGLHEYSSALWLPLGLVHLGGLLVDRVAGLGWLDLVVPFRVPYGELAVGLGTIAFDLLLVVLLTSWFRAYFRPETWLTLHHLAYVALVLSFLHGALAGTDFNAWPIALFGWGGLAALAVFTAGRMLKRRPR